MVFCILAGLFFVGCASHGDVRFEWFNLSTNEIWVIDVTGLPAEASPGRLIQNRSEDRLERSESVFSETIWLKERITIKWNEAPGGIPPRTAHQVELKRDELGIPAKLSGGKIRFTYIGGEQWRVKILK